MNIPRWLISQEVRNRLSIFRKYSPREFLYANSISFSQFGEDVILDCCFFRDQAEGFYVDIGAFHPIDLSNIYAFYRRGWRGICIEPNPQNFPLLARSRPRDIHCNLAVSSEEGPVKFTIDSVYSGLRDTAAPHENRPGKEIVVQARPLAAILAEHLPAGMAIDFFSIACEGHDLAVLESNDWSRFRPRVVVVEDLTQQCGGPLDIYLRSLGYSLFTQVELAKIYTDGSRPFPAAVQ